MARRRTIGGATVSFHPAGHVPGSAQIRVEVAGEVWVASGDYKTTPDGLSEPFEPVRCHAFITESTFGLPVFEWRPFAEENAAINDWWRACAAAGRPAVIGAYALGKAQRILANLDPSIGPILTHGAIENTNAILRAQGIALPGTIRVTAETKAKDHPGALVLATPGAMGGPWMKRFPNASTAFASGWMAMRGVRRRRAADRGFVMSDHADWPGLNAAIEATGRHPRVRHPRLHLHLHPLAPRAGLRRPRRRDRVRGRDRRGLGRGRGGRCRRRGRRVIRHRARSACPVHGMRMGCAWDVHRLPRT